MGNKDILEKIITSLINDTRMTQYTGHAIPYRHCSYEKIFGNKYQEILSNGFKISILINEQELIPNYITLYVWTNEIYNKVYVQESGMKDILELQIRKLKEIKEILIKKLLKKEICKKIKSIM